jgi:hypothetical protein
MPLCERTPELDPGLRRGDGNEGNPVFKQKCITLFYRFPNTDGLTIARIFAASGIIGYGAGTWLGLTYHPAIDYSFWQTTFIGASSFAGTVMGIAVPLIAQSNSRQPYIVAGVFGGWAGFYFGEKLSLALFEKTQHDKRSSAIDFELPGIAALPAILTEGKLRQFRRVSSGIPPALPVAELVVRF